MSHTCTQQWTNPSRSRFPSALIKTFKRAFLWSPPNFHCLYTSCDTSSFPLDGFGQHRRRSVALIAYIFFDSSPMACKSGGTPELSTIHRSVQNVTLCVCMCMGTLLLKTDNLEHFFHIILLRLWTSWSRFEGFPKISQGLSPLIPIAFLVRGSTSSGCRA